MDPHEKEIFKSYVSALRLCMDTNSDPVENFVAYAFGNMHNLRDNPVFKKIHDELMYVDLFDFLVKTGNLTPLLDKYRICRQFYESNIKDILQCNGLRQYCDGWPAFNANWNPDSFNLSRTLGSLNALGFYAIMTVNVFYKENKRLIEITFSLPNEDTYSEDVIISTEAHEKLKKLELSDLKTEDVINDLNYVAEKLRELNLNNLYWDYSRQRLTREEITNRQEFDYISFVEVAIGGIEENDIFYICTQWEGDVLFQILQCLSDLDPKVLANFIMISAITDFLKYSKIIETSFFPLLIENALSLYTDSDSDKRYIEMAEHFLKSVHKAMDQVNSEAIEDSEDCLRERKLIEQYRNMFFSEEKFLKEYESLESVSDDFYQNITNLQRWGPPELIREFLGNIEAYNVLNEYVNFAIKTYKKPMLHCILTNDYEKWFYVLSEQNIDSDEYKEKINKLKSISKELIALQNEQDNNENDKDENIEIDSYYYERALDIIRVLRLMFVTYKDWLNRNEAIAKEQNEILSEIGLNNHQFFFVVFAIIHLIHSAESDRQIGNIKDNLCFVGMEEFIHEFKCKSNKFKNSSLGQ